MNILYVFPIVGLALLWITVELHACQRNWETWTWVQKIYNKYPALQKVRW